MSEPTPSNAPRRKWRMWKRIAGLLSGVVLLLLALCVLLPKPLIHSKKEFACGGCGTLAKSCDAFQQSALNPNGSPPRTLGELHRPPWGGGTFLPDGEHNLRDPWGNPYLMQPRTRADGLPYLLIVSIAPDGTLISQCGVGGEKALKFET